jgi:hypothetical protein
VVDLTAIVAEDPGPLAVLQVRDTVLGVAVRAAFSMPEPAVNAINTERIWDVDRINLVLKDRIGEASI